MRPTAPWISLLACVCMLSGGAADLSSEPGKSKNAAEQAAKNDKSPKDDKQKNKDKDKAVKPNKPLLGEARPGRNDDDPRLLRWDLDHDGVLSRAEWKASTQLFDRLDVNRYDVLSAAELAERP